MRAKEFVVEADSYSPPTLNVGDRILKGKFKNSPAEIKGFTKDKHNQPVLKTNRGEVQLFKPRVTKLMDNGVSEGGPETTWSDDTDTITLQDILELTKHIKQINLPINDNLKSKLLHWEGNPEEIERVNQVTVSNQFPILIMVDKQGQIEWILDGNHRLHKAIQSQAKTIPAKLIKPSDLNDKAKKIFNIKEQGVAEGFPQPGPSSGAPKQFGSDAKIQTRQMTVKDIISSIPGVPYYNNVVDDWDAKDYSWGVTKKVIEYATYLKDHPESLAKLPPAIVLNGKFEDGAHRVSAIWLLQQRMDPKNPLWKNAKLNVQFVKQGVAEDQNINLDIDYFMNEGCGIFAVAMALNEDNSQIYIISNKNGQSWSKSFPYEISHVFVNVLGKGQFDIRGKRSPEKMANDFNLNKEDYSIKGPFTPKEFFSKFMGDSDTKPLYGTSKDIKQVQQQIKSNLDEKLQGVAEGDVIRTKFATKQAQKNKDQYQRQPDIEIPLYDRIRNQSVLPKYAYLSKDKLEPFDHFEIQTKSPKVTQIIGVTTDTRKVVVSTMMAPPESVEKFVAAMNRGGFSDVPIQRVSIKGYNDTDTKLDESQGVSEGLSIDVPNEEWLQDKIDYAKRKGRDEWGAPFFGSTTAYVRPNPQVSVVRLEMLKGMRNEQNNVRKKDLEWLMAYMEKTGKLPPDPHGNEYAPYVMVAYNGEAWVNEGNHRIMAAYRLGWKKMPIEIKYFDGGERVESGIMYPGKIGLGQPAGKPISR